MGHHLLPADALGLSAKLLKDHMTIFINFEEEMEAGGLDGLDGPMGIHGSRR